MPVSVGTRLGALEVTGVLGAGGMGACGRRAERVCEPKRGHAPVVGPRRTQES